MADVHDLAGWASAWAREHGGATCALAALAVVALTALLVWFVVFSGLSGPVQFVYGGF